MLHNSKEAVGCRNVLVTKQSCCNNAHPSNVRRRCLLSAQTSRRSHYFTVDNKSCTSPDTDILNMSRLSERKSQEMWGVPSEMCVNWYCDRLVVTVKKMKKNGSKPPQSIFMNMSMVVRTESISFFVRCHSHKIQHANRYVNLGSFCSRQAVVYCIDVCVVTASTHCCKRRKPIHDGINKNKNV